MRFRNNDLSLTYQKQIKMTLKVVKGLRTPKKPSNDELAIKIFKLLATPFDLHDIFDSFENEEDCIDLAYYHKVKTESKHVFSQVYFSMEEMLAPKYEKCHRICLGVFSGVYSSSFVMKIAILMQFNTKLGVRFVLENVSTDENMFLNMYYSNDFDDTNDQLSYIHDMLSRMDLDEIKIEGLF